MACDTQVVRIRQNGTVDPDKPLELSKKAKQRIVWVSESDQDYDIRFDNKRSPFRDHELAVPRGGWAESGEIMGDPGTYTYHTYRGGTMQVAADPDVIVQN